MKILLPVDGSEYTKRTLNYLAEHNELLGSGREYTVFTAVPQVPPNAARFVDHRIIEDFYREEAEKVLEPVKAFADQQGWKIRVAYAAGHAADVIATYAEKEKHDLIVMGSHGHSLLRNVILGSVTSGVLARSKIPVLLIR